MKPNEYQQLCERTAGELPTRDRLINFGLGIVGEAGEVADHVKKVIFHGHEMDKDKLIEELGDNLWYIATLATTAGTTLEKVMEMNVLKLKLRYPDGFDQERSKLRED